MRFGERGNDLECIFPARHGLQIGSGCSSELMTIPVTKSPFRILAISAIPWWQQRRCQSDGVRGNVEAMFADSECGTVYPSS